MFVVCFLTFLPGCFTWGEFQGNATFALTCWGKKVVITSVQNTWDTLQNWHLSSANILEPLWLLVSCCQRKSQFAKRKWNWYLEHDRVTDLNGLRTQLCITFLTHLIKIRDSVVRVTSSLQRLMIQVLTGFYSSLQHMQVLRSSLGSIYDSTCQ